MELAVESYVGLLMSLGAIGFGWLLAFRSQSALSFFSQGKRSRYHRMVRMVEISGWISLVGGCLSIAMFLILLVVIAFQSLWS
jgi:hypothetical protein